MKYITNLLVLVAVCVTVAGCSDEAVDPDIGKVSGVLRGRTGRDASTITTLANATVRIEPGGKVVTTGQFGEFTFDRPAKDSIVMTAIMDGYDALALCLPPALSSRTFELGFVDLPRSIDTALTSVSASLVSVSGDTAVVTVSGRSNAHDLMSVGLIAADAPPADTAFVTSTHRTGPSDGTTFTVRVPIHGTGSGLFAVVAAGRTYRFDPWFCGGPATGLGPTTTVKIR